MAQTSALIDIDRILDEKAGARARWIPRFLRSYLKRIVHQDEINAFLSAHDHLEGVAWIEAVVEYLDFRLEVEGLEHLPADATGRRYTFVSNHPLGGPDGLALGMLLGKHYEGRIKYLVNDLLMNLRSLAPLCVPINKTGSQSRDFPQQVEAAFAGNDHVIMFPAGLCSRREQGVVHDLPWRKTFITKSVETERDVVPIYFSGTNSDRFYRLASWCKRLGLKVNIAMLYLADEMFRNRHRTFHVVIGAPIPWQTFDQSRRPAAWAAWVEEKVYEQGAAYQATH